MSVEPSSTTTSESTHDGTDWIADFICASSLNAGITTATRQPLRIKSAAAGTVFQ
jgi:hypothetical protein